MSESNKDSGPATFFVMLSMCIVFSAMSCNVGYKNGYDAHREDVCIRDHGVWMERVGTDRKACVFGVRR